MSEEQYSPLIERKILGTAIIYPDTWGTLNATLKPETFTSPIHGRMWAEIVRAYNEGYNQDPTIISQKLIEADMPDAATQILPQALGDPAPPSTISLYLERIVQAHRASCIALINQKYAQKLAEAAGDPTLTLSLTRDQIEELEEVERETSQAQWDILSDLYEDAVANPLPADVPTGFLDLDEKLNGGFRRGQFIIVAARPAMGKSVFGTDLARHAALRCGIPALFISLEMSRREVAQRIAAAETSVTLSSITKGDLNYEQHQKIKDAFQKIQGAPLHIAEPPTNEWLKIKQIIRDYVFQNGAGLVVIDYLGLMTGDKSQGRQNEIADISRDIKSLARALQIPIVALSQLNRESQSSGDHRPKMSQLRESGSLEQDADIVILLHREDYYEKETERAGEADIDLAKNRNGQTGVVSLAFQSHYTKFANMARGY